MSDSCRVLYIEDTPEDARLLQEGIHAASVPVSLTTVSTAEHALQILSSPTEVDVIVLDWNLPGKTGDELLCAIRKCRASTPVFVLTGLPVSVAASQVKDRIETVLAKPFTLEAWEDLARLLANFCEDMIALGASNSTAD